MKNGSTTLCVLFLWSALLMRAQLHAANPPRGELPEKRLGNVVQLAAVADPADGDSSAGRRANHQTPKGAQNDPWAKTLADNRPLRISSVTADKERVEIYNIVELTAEIAATYDNPFDPDQIAVDASVITPEGKVLSVPGFLYAPMRLETEA